VTRTGTGRDSDLRTAANRALPQQRRKSRQNSVKDGLVPLW